jgi:hypothetical protein
MFDPRILTTLSHQPPDVLQLRDRGAADRVTDSESWTIDNRIWLNAMRKLLISLLAAIALSLAGLGSALGHVHGITPLRCVGVPDDGANAVDHTAAAAANGGPIGGLIPRDVGNAPLTAGDGGFDTPACPAD